MNFENQNRSYPSDQSEQRFILSLANENSKWKQANKNSKSACIVIYTRFVRKDKIIVIFVHIYFIFNSDIKRVHGLLWVLLCVL